MTIKYITQKEAQQIDDDLMSEEGAFSLDQAAHGAGWLVVCSSFSQGISCRELSTSDGLRWSWQSRDGLVAARHLKLFGYTPTLYFPKPGSKDIYKRLLKQCQNMDIPSVESEDAFATSLKANDVILDAIFGFSFHPPLRAPFDKVLPLIKNANLPIISIDIPSGWDVTSGPQPLETQRGETVETFMPDVLISLTAPKEGVKLFRGRHFLGGRFVPRSLMEKYSLNLPPYPGTDQVVEL